MSGGNSNGADRSRSEAKRAQRGRPRDEASGRSDMGSNDTGAWFERRLRAPSFVIPEERSSSVDRGSPIRSLPEIADFRRQRGPARERSGAFGNAIVTAEVRYFPVTKHYPLRCRKVFTSPMISDE